MNRIFFMGFSFMSLLSAPVAFAQEEALCDKDLSALNDERKLVSEISAALAGEEAAVTVAYVASADIENGDVQKARSLAIRSAFRQLVSLVVRNIVSPERLLEVQDRLAREIYGRSRVFIHSFEAPTAQICQNQYRLAMRVVLKTQELRKTLFRSGILNLEYAVREVRLLHVKYEQDYEWIRNALLKNIRHLKRISEKYQKKGEIRFLVETPSSVDEMMARLDSAAIGAENAPKFKVQRGEDGGLEVLLLTK